MRILNFFIDIMFFVLDIIGVGLCCVGNFLEVIIERVFMVIEVVFDFLFDIIPNKISLFYRIQRIFYPTKSDFDLKDFDTEQKNWLDENVGKYRWKIVKRKTSSYDSPNRYLCFRQKTDAVAFKLRWI